MTNDVRKLIELELSGNERVRSLVDDYNRLSGAEKALFREASGITEEVRTRNRGRTGPQQSWIREQDLAVIYLKLEHKERLTQTHPDVERLAKAMNRTEASIWMRKGNFDSLDPSVVGAGLSHPAKLTVSSWAEYERDPERVFAEARRAYLNLVS